MLDRFFRLGALLPVRPIEFWDRTSALVERGLDNLRPAVSYTPQPHHELLGQLKEVLQVDPSPILREEPYLELKEQLREDTEELRSKAPYPLAACGDMALQDICYFLFRALRPELALETGVLYGITTASILLALEQNGSGLLHSIDLPPLRRNQIALVGCLVPARLRERWILHHGASRRVLPKLLSVLSPIQLFVHDSLHTYRNMKYELETVSTRLAPQSAVIVDDIQGNPAFMRWSKTAAVRYVGTAKETAKPGLMGVAVL